ncbi:MULTISPECIES: hypothetical protein [Cytobacillus]|uniref:hypothetical protein n=1 Tax=Cytobacillus TaxID=2675230 RepID=UPI0020404BF3|nr:MULTISPECIES: hypothetical protein [Cytobacillus]MCM3394844.1 hypothetical protein [Cytobacillus oceanisediminis]UQX56077.1 hypothetical protein M5V91_10855 [Cytobacillus pseudoceanisediminis]
MGNKVITIISHKQDYLALKAKGVNPKVIKRKWGFKKSNNDDSKGFIINLGFTQIRYKSYQ